jgi:hypothetical protein
VENVCSIQVFDWVHLGTLGTRLTRGNGYLSKMDFWDDVSRVQIRKSAVVHRAGAGCCLEGSSLLPSWPAEIWPGRLDLDWTAARLMVTDSLASAAGRDAHLLVARPGRIMIGPNPTAARLVVTDSLASAAGGDTAGPIGSGLNGSSPRGDRQSRERGRPGCPPTNGFARPDHDRTEPDGSSPESPRGDR